MAVLDSEHVVQQEQTTDYDDLAVHIDHNGTPSDDEADCCGAEESAVTKTHRLPKLDTVDAADEEDTHVFEITMSRAASYMKSPTTPAAEKSRALDASKDYFGSDSLSTVVETEDHASIAPESHDTNEVKAPPDVSLSPKDAELPSGPTSGENIADRRHSIIADAFAATRRRATVSSAVVTESLRKFLPDISNLSLKSRPSRDLLRAEKQGSKSQSRRSSLNTNGKSRDGSAIHSRQRSPEPSVDHTSRRQWRDSQTDGAAYSVFESITSRRSKSRRRAASADSLFLSRTATGASLWDDPSVYQEVGAQTNSRMKAITDTLADSNIRLPKLPSVRLPGHHPSLERSRSEDDHQQAINNIEPKATRDVPTKPIGRKGDNAGIEYIGPSQRAHPIISSALEKITGDIIVMGGYRGSILRDAQPPYRQVWAPVKIGLNIRKVDLEVGLEDEDEEKMEERIIPSGTLSHIGPIDICRRLLRHLRKSPNCRDGSLRVHDYGYDWRLSPHLLSRRLITFLENLPCNQPSVPKAERGAWIIAHSLGGLIVRHAINQRPELFAGVVYAGVPQHAVNILGPLRNGDDVLLSSRVLTAQVNFTLRTSFALLPLDGRCFIEKSTNRRLDIDFFDPKMWEEHCLSPCISAPHPPASGPRESRKSIVDRITDHAPTWIGGKDSNTNHAAPLIESSIEPTMKSSSSSSKPAEPSQPDTDLSIASHSKPHMSYPTTHNSKPHPNPHHLYSTDCTLPLPLCAAPTSPAPSPAQDPSNSPPSTAPHHTSQQSPTRRMRSSTPNRPPPSSAPGSRRSPPPNAATHSTTWRSRRAMGWCWRQRRSCHRGIGV